MRAARIARMANLSTRGKVLTGDDVMIGGLIIAGDTPKRMIARVGGPSLSVGWRTDRRSPRRPGARAAQR